MSARFAGKLFLRYRSRLYPETIRPYSPLPPEEKDIEDGAANSTLGGVAADGRITGEGARFDRDSSIPPAGTCRICFGERRDS